MPKAVEPSWRLAFLDVRSPTRNREQGYHHCRGRARPAQSQPSPDEGRSKQRPYDKGGLNEILKVFIVLDAQTKTSCVCGTPIGMNVSGEAFNPMARHCERPTTAWQSL